MSLSSDNVIHAGQKYTISLPSGRGMSIDYKSVFRLAISCTVLEKWAKKSENRKIWANFDHPANFFGGSPENFETSFGYFFSGTIARKSLDHAPRGWEKISPPNFFGERPPKGYIS